MGVMGDAGWVGGGEGMGEGEGWMEVRGKRGFTNKEALGGQYINLAGPVVLLEFVWCLLGVVEFCLVSVGFDWACLVLFVACLVLLPFAWFCLGVHCCAWFIWCLVGVACS